MGIIGVLHVVCADVGLLFVLLWVVVLYYVVVVLNLKGVFVLLCWFELFVGVIVDVIEFEDVVGDYEC